jgi:hypothetical protein
VYVKRQEECGSSVGLIAGSHHPTRRVASMSDLIAQLRGGFPFFISGALDRGAPATSLVLCARVSGWWRVGSRGSRVEGGRLELETKQIHTELLRTSVGQRVGLGRLSRRQAKTSVCQQRERLARVHG